MKEKDNTFYKSSKAKNIEKPETGNSNNSDFHFDSGSSKRKKIIIWSSVGLVLLILVICGIFYVDRIVNRPQDLFVDSIPTPTPTPAQTQQVADTAQSPEPTEIDYLEQLRSMADFTDMKGIINVLLIGIDYAEERDNNKKQYVNKDFNSDVMLLLAINYDEKKADLISIPRDTYAKIANAPDAPYKLNFSLAVGGGMCPEGYMNVCKSVEWMIGGIPVNYYIAVTMPMLKDVVNTFGGVDYEVDLDFKIQGRQYKKGMQHMDGQGVLDYCRVRKNLPGSLAGDANRVNRQKKMMLTVYSTIREKTQLKDIPNLINILNKNVFTNLTFEQCAALAVMGNSMDLDTVNMYSMYGPTINVFEYNFVFTNQKNRIQIIKTVYGVDVAALPSHYSSASAMARWNSLQIDQILPRAREALNSAKNAYKTEYTNNLLPEWERKKKEVDDHNAMVDNWTDLENPAPAKKPDPPKPETPDDKYAAAASAIDNEDIEAVKAEFAKLGISCNYNVNIYKSGQPRMKE